MQIICTWLQTDNIHANTSPFSFYRPDALPAAQPTVSNAPTRAQQQLGWATVATKDMGRKEGGGLLCHICGELGSRDIVGLVALIPPFCYGRSM